VSNKIAKDIFTNTQNNKRKKPHGSKNKLDAKDVRSSDIPTKYSNCDKNISGVSQTVQISTNVKTKRKKKNKERKQEMNDRANKSAARVDDAKGRIEKLQMPARNLDLEHRKMKMKKLNKVNEKKMKQMSTEVEAQQIKSDKILKLNKHKINIKILTEMFDKKFQVKQKVTQLALRDRMIMQLKASRFRFINEILYNNDSPQSKHYFKKDPDAFMAYHEGYKQQIEQWAVNPLDVIISSIKKLLVYYVLFLKKNLCKSELQYLYNYRPMDNVIADFGCGEARLATSVPHTVHSFDFIALNDKVKACDMAHTPLLMNSVHIVVFCLSLMGSNLKDYIIEANRVLKNK